jgi:hypothetical protein
MLSLLLALLMLFPFLVSGFVTPRLTHAPLTLHFANKKSQNTAGQGFGW